MPGEPLVTVSQSAAFEVAVHVHAGAEALTKTMPVAPVAATVSEPGEIEKVHGGGGGAACATVKACPLIAIVPVRAAPRFASTLKLTIPLPTPPGPLVTISQPAFDAAVHVHVDADAPTLTVPDAAVSATF